MRVVLTRPKEDSERTAEAVRARGHDVLIAPLLRIEPVNAELRTNWGGVIITSANAASAIAAHPALEELTKLPVFAVGKRSADAAHQVGFTDITTAGGDVRDLVRTIVEHHADAKGPLLYLAGEDRSGDLLGDLTVHGVATELVVVYRAVAASLPMALLRALRANQVDAVLHFSRRSAESYIAGSVAMGAATVALAVRHFCLSEQVAEPLRNAGAKSVAVAMRPDEAAMIELLESPQA
jgi:uroporphyrinogen-III synthase